MAKIFLTLPSQKSEHHLFYQTEIFHPKASNQHPPTSISSKDFRIFGGENQPQFLGLEPVFLEKKGEARIRWNFGVSIRFWSQESTRRMCTKIGAKISQPLILVCPNPCLTQSQTLAFFNHHQGNFPCLDSLIFMLKFEEI